MLKGNLRENYLAQEYKLDNNYPRNRWTTKSKDVDSNAFKFRDSVNYRTIWIVRIDGFWQIEEHNAEYVILHYRSSQITESKEPECNLEWIPYNKAWHDYGVVEVPTDVSTQNICFTRKS